jgi:hypothetical protein
VAPERCRDAAAKTEAAKNVRRSPRRRGRLQGSASPERGAVDRAPGRERASVAAAGGILDRLVGEGRARTDGRVRS